MIKFNKFWNMNVIPTEKKIRKRKTKIIIIFKELKEKGGEK